VCALVSEHVCVCVQNNAHSSDKSGLDLSKRVAEEDGPPGERQFELYNIIYINNNSHLSEKTATVQYL